MERGGNILKNSVGYMISPLGLTERQMLIYQKLYEKCDFTDMTVKYTIEQLSCDIKIVNIDRYATGRELKKMIKQGYLRLIIQGRRGKPSIYEIVKMCNLSANIMQPNCNLKHSKKEGLTSTGASNMQSKCNLNATPIKEKEKEKEYINIYSHWNSKKIIVHKVVNDDIRKSIDKALKKYSKQEIKEAINIYAEILESEFYFDYKWTLKEFLNRKNGISTFTNNGMNKINYEQYKNKNNKEVTEHGGTTRKSHRKSL